MRLIPGPLRGAFSLLLFTLNTIFWVLPLLVFHLVKIAGRGDKWRGFWSRVQDGIGTVWISLNNLNLRITNPARWDVELPDGLRMDRWYLVVANHQTWVDILVLQRILNRKVPFLKFFLKKELIRVPFLGLAWWALDYPFLERSGSATKDRETTYKACEKFKAAPVSVMNFLEGTRFTPAKHDKQNSPYRHLLKPKVGGVSFVLTAMSDQIHSILDVTIAYPSGAPNMWEFLCGRTPEIRVRSQLIPIEGEIAGDYSSDRNARKALTERINELWEEKDETLDGLLGEPATLTVGDE